MEADSGAAYGQAATDFISKFQVRHAFLSIGALDTVAGPMNATILEAQFASTALRCAAHRVILADSSKFDKTAFVKVCDYPDIEVVVTEKPPSAKFFAAFGAAGTKLVIAS